MVEPRDLIWISMGAASVLAVGDDETTASAMAFLTDALGAFSVRVTPVPTGRGSCFTVDAFEAASERHGMQHRETRTTRRKPTAWSDASTVG